MRVFLPTERPKTWHDRKADVRRRWALAFIFIDWSFEWAAFFLSNWKFLEMLEYVGSLSVLVAVLFYFSESGDRAKQKHYQAWQVINTAQGKGGSGGRIEALQELNADHVALVGVDVSGAFLQGIRLSGAKLLRSNFSATDSRGGDFRYADFTDANLSSANFRESTFYKASLQGAQLNDADLFGADLTEANLARANLANADLRDANLSNIHWREIANLKMANINGVKNAPDGFVSWAVKNGALTAEPNPE
jgi:Pentapeptide repeats (8 copies)